MFKKIEIGVWVFLIFSFLVILVGNAGLSGKTDIIHETNGTIERIETKCGRGCSYSYKIEIPTPN
jgi:hypothetical protein